MKKMLCLFMVLMLVFGTGCDIIRWSVKPSSDRDAVDTLSDIVEDGVIYRREVVEKGYLIKQWDDNYYTVIDSNTTCSFTYLRWGENRTCNIPISMVDILACSEEDSYMIAYATMDKSQCKCGGKSTCDYCKEQRSEDNRRYILYIKSETKPTQEPAVIKALLHDLLNNIQINETFQLGKYEQDGIETNGKEDIEWIVLARDGDRILVVSQKGLCAKPYNDVDAQITWEKCSLRKWLNEGFLSASFSDVEKSIIELTERDNLSSVYYGTNGGAPTEDKVFLLDIDEVTRYFASDSDRIVYPADHIKNDSNNENDDYASSYWWWVSTPGSAGNLATVISNEGSTEYMGKGVSTSTGLVRPAMWITIP